MPVFSYRAINDDGKEIRGSIESLDVDAAKTALKDLHLDILDVTESTRVKPVIENKDSAQPTAALTFAFEGMDASGAVRRGTIQATSKFNAFQKLKNEQELSLSMLASMGTLPKYNDPDLAEWQKASQPKESPTPVSQQEKPKVSFTSSAPLQVQKEVLPKIAETVKTNSSYQPLVQTLMLYAGWLLAWYGLFVALGYYANTRALSWDIPFVQAFYVSPFIFSFTIAIFSFLLLSAINKKIHGRWIGAIILTVIGTVAFVWIRTLL